jgi:2'-5' RNA ligase
MRVFVAIVLPDPFKHAILEATADLCAARDELRWIQASHLHLTLAFLGDLDDRGTDLVEEAAERVASASRPFTLTATGLVALPRRSSSRVLAAAIGEGSPEAAALALALERALVDIGDEAGHTFRPPEARPFTAHITLARSGRVPATFTAKELDIRIDASARIAELAVYESILGAEGARYHELARFALASASSVEAQRRYAR